MRVEGGLYYGRGNGTPYFSLTQTTHRKGFPNQCYSGGCDHKTILRHYPRFADLAALHLCDINGAPMHGGSWYNLAGALGGMGERYHVGNSERHFPISPERIDPAKPWATTEYRKPTEAECLQIFADHCRVSLSDARAIAEEVKAELGQPMEDGNNAWLASDYARARAKLTAIMEGMRPRWKREADACIAHHNLRVFGDEWPDAKAAA